MTFPSFRILLFLFLSIRAQDYYHDRASNQWWSDYASLDEYDDDDLDRHMNLIITKNILPGDAPLPFDESQFYRRPPTSSEELELEFAPPPRPPPPRQQKNRKNPIASSTIRPPPRPTQPPPPPPPPQTFRPSPKPIFRPALTRPSTRLVATRPPPTRPPPIEDDFLDEVEVETEEIAPPPPFVRDDSSLPAIPSDSQNVLVTQVPFKAANRFPFVAKTQSRSDFTDEPPPPPPPPKNFIPSNSVVFVPPASDSSSSSFTFRPSHPITRQSLAPNGFFSSPSPTTSSFSAAFESQTPQGRRTQVLKRRFRPSTEFPVSLEPEHLQPEPEPEPEPEIQTPSRPPAQFRSERRRVRINSELEELPKTKRIKKPVVDDSVSTFPVASTVGRLLEPQRIATTFRPLSPAVKSQVIRKKVPASSPPSSNTVSQFVRRRPVIATTPFFSSPPPPPSPDVEVRGRVVVPVTTFIPQLLFSTTPSPVRHTPIESDISSNTEIISPAELRQVARQQQREHSRFRRDENEDDWTPPCYDGSASFCSYGRLEYPEELMNEVIGQRETELKRLFSQFRNEMTVEGGDRNKSKSESESVSKFACESVARTLRPGWAKDAVSGKWLLVVNSNDDIRFQQNVRIETCSRRNEACHFISPFYRSSCVERENIQRLVAIDPRDHHLQPFVALFSMPRGCSCRIGSTINTHSE